MVLLSDYGRVILEVNEEEIIYKKRVIKKCDIRSLYYDENILAILCYNGKVHSLNMNSLLFSERKKLEYLYSELNKENMLFNIDKRYIGNTGLYWLLFFIPRYSNSYICLTWIIILSVLICTYIIEKKKYVGTFYNLDKEEFEVLKNDKVIKIKRKDVEYIKIKEINLGSIVEIVYKKSKYKMFIRENVDCKKLYNK
ncbi:hypothetical protein UT300007_03280 [Clostridium sp. CTA-7]